jgi:hypothetical protein
MKGTLLRTVGKSRPVRSVLTVPLKRDPRASGANGGCAGWRSGPAHFLPEAIHTSDTTQSEPKHQKLLLILATAAIYLSSEPADQ